MFVAGWPIALADMMIESLPDARVMSGLATAQWSDMQRAFFGDLLTGNRRTAEGQTVHLSARTPSGISRSAQLFMPERLRNGAPLVVMLHGCMQDPESLARLTGMNSLASESGFAVLYPDQETEASAVQCWLWYSPEHQSREGGEPEVLARLIEQAQKLTGTGAEATHVAGISAGGALTALMIHLYPEMIASAAIIAGPLPFAAESMDEAMAQMALGPNRHQAKRAHDRAAQEAEQAPSGSRRLPVLIVHGAQDRLVGLQHAREQVKAVMQLNDQLDDGISNDSLQAAVEKKRGEFGEISIWHDSDGFPVAILVVPSLMGHAWSGGKIDEPFAQPGFDLSRLVTDFFLASENEDWREFSADKLAKLLRRSWLGAS